jgi:hypothetical protein
MGGGAHIAAFKLTNIEQLRAVLACLPAKIRRINNSGYLPQKNNGGQGRRYPEPTTDPYTALLRRA